MLLERLVYKESENIFNFGAFGLPVSLQNRDKFRKSSSFERREEAEKRTAELKENIREVWLNSNFDHIFAECSWCNIHAGVFLVNLYFNVLKITILFENFLKNDTPLLVFLAPFKPGNLL